MKKVQDLNIGIRNFIFILITGFVILFYFLAFEGLILSDDYSYAEYAFRLLQGTFIPDSDIFSHRLGMILPVSALYHFFGVSDLTTTVVALVCFLLTGYLLFRQAPDGNGMVGLYAVMLALLSFYPIYFSNKLFPDTIVAFFILASAVVLFKRGSIPGGGVLFVLCFFFGFLTKETILYIFPFYLLVLIRDLRFKQHSVFWISAGAAFILSAVLYLGLYKYFTGHFLYRFDVIHEGHYVSAYSYYDKPLEYTLRRISYEPLFMLISSELFIPLALAMPVLVRLRIRDFFSMDKTEKFWGILSLLLLATFWFGTTSYKFYNPISLNPRMFLVCVPVWAITAGIALEKGRIRKVIYLVYSLVFLTVSLLYLYWGIWKVASLYGLFGAVFLLMYLVPVMVKRLPYILFLLMLIHPLYFLWKADRNNFNDQRAVIETYLSGGDRETIVLTDPLIKACSLYFYRFVPDENYSYYSYMETDLMNKAKADRYYALVNPKNLKEMADTGHAVPEYFNKPPENWRLIFKKGEVCLFEIGGAEIPDKH